MVQQTASATQQQSQTSRQIAEQASMVRDYTRHLKRAMTEQETGSRAISSEEAVTGPQQSWQPTMQVNAGICCRSWSIWRSLAVFTGVGAVGCCAPRGK